jgi:organic hydroperoxide reductase OsmC/OhrA
VKTHAYELQLFWDGNRGAGTATYDAYGREYRICVAHKPDLLGTADVMFRGAADRHNPEDLYLAALASCHMLAYLALCARRGIVVTSYRDSAEATLSLDPAGGGRFTDVTLRPHVLLRDDALLEEAFQLHDMAHKRCFIASSSNVPIRCLANVRAEAQ